MLTNIKALKSSSMFNFWTDMVIFHWLKQTILNVRHANNLHYHSTYLCLYRARTKTSISCHRRLFGSWSRGSVRALLGLWRMSIINIFNNIHPPLPIYIYQNPWLYYKGGLVRFHSKVKTYRKNKHFSYFVS